MHPPERLHLPRRPPEPPPAHFPVIASLAPLAAAGLIWAITGSAFVLVFGCLGPVIAGATMLDGRRINRRTARRNAAAWLEARDEVRSAVAGRHDRFRDAAWLRTPAAATILSGGADENRWRPGRTALVTLGAGTIPSDVELDGEPGDDADRELCDWAALVKGAPVTADIEAGLGLAGPPALARAMARSVLVQLAHARAPAGTSVGNMPVEGWEWTKNLPHASAGESGACEITIAEITSAEITSAEGADAAAPPGADVTELLVAIGDRPDRLPPRCATVIRLSGPALADVIRSPSHPSGLTFRPELVTEAQAVEFAFSLASAADRSGLASVRRDLPVMVPLAELLPYAGQDVDQRVGANAPTATLACPIGVGENGTVVIDLVDSGPHAIVGGTTGSGKSELLVTWVVAMASVYPPTEVTFLLVDFKGGAAFTPLRSVPHCVGVITDLDERQAARALASLRAELRYREQVLRDAGARDITDPVAAGALPRLVIVVDEFQAMLDTQPALHDLFVSLAARGRSLGIHLILCTQRPAGVVHDSLLANCSLRLSLRVNNAADSRAVIGTETAASIPRSRPGRFQVQGADGVQTCQSASTTGADIARVAEPAANLAAPRRPWLDPLPGLITMDALSSYDPSVPRDRLLGLADEPEQQRYRVATWDPADDGHLLVVGDAGSGKSSLLRSLAARTPSAVWSVPPDVEAVWDALAAATAHADAMYADTTYAETTPSGIPTEDSTGFPLILLDDLDAVLTRWDPEYQLAAVEALTRLLRDGASAGIRMAIAVQRLVGPFRHLPALCGNTLLLRVADRDDYRAAGGVQALFDPDLPPGAGLWKGARTQLMVTGSATDPIAGASTGNTGTVPTPAVGSGTGTLVVVSGAPAHTRARLDALSASTGRSNRIIDVGANAATPDGAVLRVADRVPGAVFIGTPENWQREWSLLSALRPTATMTFDRCSVAEFRHLSGSRQLPPPLAAGRNHLWQFTPDGAVSRVALPTASPSAPT